MAKLSQKAWVIIDPDGEVLREYVSFDSRHDCWASFRRAMTTSMGRSSIKSERTWQRRGYKCVEFELKAKERSHA